VRGLTGEVVAIRFWDQFRAMQVATLSERAADIYQNNWGSLGLVIQDYVGLGVKDYRKREHNGEED
jgi:hypothetical protein